MIDWVTARLSLASDPAALDWSRRAGCTITVRPGGEVDYVTDRWLPIQGSHEAAMRARPGAKGLWLSGNPAKLITGQNLDGGEDLPALMSTVVRKTATVLAPAMVAVPLAGILSRVDITRTYDLGAVERVREVLRVAAITARARRQGAAATSHQTVYLGRHSRRHSVKMYSKFDEIQSHPPAGIPEPVRLAILEQARGLLRIEVTVRGMQMDDDGLVSLRAWSDPAVADDYFSRYWGAVELSSGVELTEDAALSLPRNLRHVYDSWRRGGDMQELLSRSAFYRHRKTLLELSTGAVDIAVLRPTQQCYAIARTDIGEYLRTLPQWRASGPLAEWIQECAA